MDYLSTFYANRKETAYDFQRIILRSYLPILEPSEKKVILVERSPLSSLNVFTKLSTENKYITDAQSKHLRLEYDKSFQHFEEKSLVFYLRTKPETAFARMKARGRPEEILNVTLKYAQRLHEL